MANEIRLDLGAGRLFLAVFCSISALIGLKTPDFQPGGLAPRARFFSGGAGDGPRLRFFLGGRRRRPMAAWQPDGSRMAAGWLRPDLGQMGRLSQSVS